MPFLHGITATEVGEALHGFENRLGGVATRLAEILNAAGSELEVCMRAQGYTVEFGAGERGYYLAREFVLSRTCAGVLRAVVQAQTEFAVACDARATELLRQLRQTPEAWSDSWDTNINTGSWRANVTLEPLTPTERPTVSHWLGKGF